MADGGALAAGRGQGGRPDFGLREGPGRRDLCFREVENLRWGRLPAEHHEAGVTPKGEDGVGVDGNLFQCAGGCPVGYRLFDGVVDVQQFEQGQATGRGALVARLPLTLLARQRQDSRLAIGVGLDTDHSAVVVVGKNGSRETRQENNKK